MKIDPNKIRKRIHLVSTLWLTMAIFYVLINALRVWGVRWWVIFSLSGYSLLLIIFLISVYLFAIYNGLTRNKNIEKEHPLTRTMAYMILYDMSPVLGAIAAAFSITPSDNFQQIASVLSTGTFAVTFLFWIIIDPLLNIVESITPESIELRKQRLNREKLAKIQEKQQQQELIEELTIYEDQQKQQWQIILKPLAEELMALLQNRLDNKNKSKIIDIGLKAWQIGGIGGMTELAGEIAEKNCTNENRLGILWQGIGDWRSKSLA